MAAQILTQERLKELVHYDPETGIFTWLNCARKGYSGKRAGTKSHGYLNIKLDGANPCGAHRLAWLYVYGYMPSIIDHKNLNRSDNRICNLREVTHSENCINKEKLSRNTSGIKGVSWHKKDKKWRAYGTKDTKTIHLGHFDTKEMAGMAVEKYAMENYSQFYRK